MAPASRMEDFLAGLARWTVALAVVLSVWLFGAAEPWAYFLICILVMGGTVAWLFSLAVATTARLRTPLLVVVLLLLCGLVGLQSVPLPDAVVEMLNPLAAGVQTATTERLRELGTYVEGAGGAAVPPATLSLAPGATRRGLFLFVAYAAVFVVLANTIRRRRHLHGIMVLMTVSTFFLAVVSVIHKLSGSDLLLGMYEPRYGGNIFGPFTNRNHFAAYINMMFGVSLGIFLNLRFSVGPFLAHGNLVGFSGFTSRRASRLLLAGFTTTLCAAALAATLSRGGILSLVLALLAVGGVLTWRTRTLAAYRSIIALVCLLMAAAFFWLGGGPLMERLGSLSRVAVNPLEDFRAIVTRDTVSMFAAMPITGAGFGAFRHAFSMFQTPGLQYRWLHAHNDWAQLLAEGGVIGAVLFLAACGLWARAVARRIDGMDLGTRLLTLGCLVGLATIGFHSAVDYSLHKPANAFTLAALSGMVLGAVHLRRRKARPRAAGAEQADAARESAWRTEAGGYRVPGPVPRVAALVLIPAAIMLVVAEASELRSELAYARFLYLHGASAGMKPGRTLQRVVAAAGGEIDLATRVGHPDADERAYLSRALLNWVADDRLDRGFRGGLLPRALDEARQAVEAAPSNYLNWLWLGRAAASIGAWDDAERCVERARELVVHPEQVRMFKPPEERDPMKDPAMREWIEGML